jgi:hypothetical protein
MKNKITKYDKKYNMILELDFITNKEESNKNESILLEMLKTEFLSQINSI